MAQHDMTIDDGSGAVVLADMNSAFQALATNSAAATAPATTFPHQWWMDEATNILKMRNAANTDWIPVGLKVAGVWTPFGVRGPNLVLITASVTYAPPADLVECVVELVGGGGASGGCQSTSGSGERACSGGGGGGQYRARRILVADLPSTIDVVIGAGGLPATALAGGAGGTTSFGTLFGAAGGGGGTRGDRSTSSTYAGGGTGGTGGSGSAHISVDGDDGGLGAVLDGNPVQAGWGGGSRFAPTVKHGRPGRGYGGGAGGETNFLNSSSIPGLQGAAGVCRIQEWRVTPV